MIGLFKKDNYLFGSIVGVIVATVTLLIIYLAISLFGNGDIVQYHKFFLLAVIPNTLLFRYYLKVLSFEKTGKAILFVTFIIIIAYFLYQFKQ